MFTSLPSADDFQILADQAVQALPKLFRQQLQGIAIIVQDVADPETLQQLGLVSPFQLMGLYRGVPLPKQNHWMPWADHPRIFLYRLPIVQFWQNANNHNSLATVIRHVLVHEIGHHFGYSDAEMDKIDNEPA